MSEKVDLVNVGHPEVCDAFASVLRSGRPQFNAQFVEARRLYPNLDGAAFLEFLRTVVDGLVRAVHSVHPETVAEVTLAAYEAGLELVGQKLAGPGARYPWMETGWKCALPSIAPILVSAPARVIRGVSNALHHLANTPGARPEQWISEFQRLAPQCKDIDALLRLGQVLAWRSGLAQFRSGAIAAADALPPLLAIAAVGAAKLADWPQLHKQLLADPWFNPAASGTDKKASAKPQFVAQAGAFRGFGGLFVEPPRVVNSGNDFLVRTGDDCWLLTADVFGATFHRSTAAEFDLASQSSQLPTEMCVRGSAVVWRNKQVELPIGGTITSSAANSMTLALTSDLTHSVLLFALT